MLVTSNTEIVMHMECIVYIVHICMNLALGGNYGCWLCQILGTEFWLANVTGGNNLGAFLFGNRLACLSDAAQGGVECTCATCYLREQHCGVGGWGEALLLPLGCIGQGGGGLCAKMPSVLCLQVVLLGIDILSALVSRLQDRFKAQIGTGKGSVCEGWMLPLL